MEGGREPQGENADRAADCDRHGAGDNAIVAERAAQLALAQDDAEKGELLEILGLAEQLNKPIPPSAGEQQA